MITSERSVADSLPGRINQGAVVLAASTVLLVAAGVGFGSFAFISGAVILASFMFRISDFRLIILCSSHNIINN